MNPQLKAILEAICYQALVWLRDGKPPEDTRQQVEQAYMRGDISAGEYLRQLGHRRPEDAAVVVCPDIGLRLVH